MFQCTGNSPKLFERRPIAVLSMLLMLALVSMQVRAQSTQGAVGGSVKDPGGAVVPGAAVTLTNTAEGTIAHRQVQQRRRLPLPGCEGGHLFRQRRCSRL